MLNKYDMAKPMLTNANVPSAENATRQLLKILELSKTFYERDNKVNKMKNI